MHHEEGPSHICADGVLVVLAERSEGHAWWGGEGRASGVHERTPCTSAVVACYTNNTRPCLQIEHQRRHSPTTPPSSVTDATAIAQERDQG